MRISATLAVMLVLLATVGCAGELRELWEAYDVAYVLWEAQFSSTELASEVVDARAVQAYRSGDLPTREAIQDAACCMLPAGRAFPLLFKLGEDGRLVGEFSSFLLVYVDPRPSPMVALIRRATDEEVFALVQAHPDADAVMEGAWIKTALTGTDGAGGVPYNLQIGDQFTFELIIPDGPILTLTHGVVGEE